MKDQRKTDIAAVIIMAVLFIGLTVAAAWADEGPPNPLHETYISGKWCEFNGGISEYRLPTGERVDCLLEEYAVEHDFSKSGKPYEASGQAHYYAIMTGKKPLVVLIRPKGQSDEAMERYGRRATRHGLVAVLCVDAVRPVITYRCPWDNLDTLINSSRE